jgi:hypothetical protein
MIESPLTKCFGVEGGEFVAFDGKTDLDWLAANFAVFYVALTTD